MLRLIGSAGLVFFGLATAAGPLDFSPVLDRIAEGTRVVVVGEIHGTRETPEAFGQLVSQAAGRFGGVTVALELTPADGVYEAFVSGGAERGQILALPFWSDGSDGRQSESMFDLLARLRELRAGDGEVSLELFDSRPGYDGEGDAALAGSLRAIIEAAGERPALVLTGNLHARKRPGASFNPDFRPMAHRLKDLPILSLDARFAGGRAWICQPGNDCGPQELGSQIRGDVPGAPGVVLFEEPDDRGFDGMIYLGRVTASPPAREVKSE